MQDYCERFKSLSWLAIALSLLVVAAGCGEAPESAVKRMEPGQEFSGFLGDYTALKPDPDIEGEMLTYVSADAMKNLRRYIACIVDPVEVYVDTEADPSLVPDLGREAVANYFRHALVDAVSDAYPVVDSPGPLVLRVRAAIVGLDVGGEVAPLELPSGESVETLGRAITIEKVGVEVELVDSESGERIAAAVDRANLGTGAEVGVENFSRTERYQEAKEAFDEWAGRLREFLDSQHELTGEDAERAVESYAPYGQ